MLRKHYVIKARALQCFKPPTVNTYRPHRVLKIQLPAKTVEFLRREFDDYVRAIEARKRVLLERLENRLEEVQQLTWLFEKLLAENELRHPVDKVPNEKYGRMVVVALSSALEESRKEHKSLREAVSILAKHPEMMN